MSGPTMFVWFSKGKNKMAAKTRWPTIQNISASLDRFINKCHKKYFIHAKTV
jgi:hypothetical protein